VARKSSDSQVREHQVKKWLSQVTPTPFKDNKLTDKQKVARITHHMTKVMQSLGLDLSDDSLQDTPKRIAKMYVHEFFSGLKAENFPKITCIENKMKCNEMVSVNGIRVLSVCEHHFVTIDGYATVAYIPKSKVIGLSKINRIVDYFSKRPQVQERLVKQVADALEAILETEDIAVHIKAKHYCVISRGVRDMESETTTTDVRGVFKTDHSARTEFLKTVVR